MMNYWSDARRGTSSASDSKDHRTPFEHDFDRLLFSTPVRRLSDKTQVWPLDRNDGVRTRLTHSHEVSNIAKSIGKRLAKSGLDFGADTNDVVLPLLGAIGLVHDLGNPPFGHQGETAIGRWFSKNDAWIFSFKCEDKGVALSKSVDEKFHPEFMEFEGNAQTIRLVSALQASPGNFGLDLTAATISALMKYSGLCHQRKRKSDDGFNCSLKKYGYFLSETQLVAWVREKTGLTIGQRHPITWIMEAADDIAYSVLDIEDGMKKGVFSPDDLLADFENELGTSYPTIVSNLKDRFAQTSKTARSIHDKREIKSSYIRTYFMRQLIEDTVLQYEGDNDEIFGHRRQLGLLDENSLCSYLKNFAFTYVFQSRSVLAVEDEGALYIDKLMDFFWIAISHRKDIKDLKSNRLSATAAYGFSLISDNYLQCVCAMDECIPMRYKELRLLTDMIAGMTDGFARSLYRDLLRDGHI